ncbi:MAG: hypothetical protein DI630_00715 [Gordonia sp. (in: high G+C Gram-positive bacteria)]|nr:MAG: hypothetical protein DI630_00715 [Gordonia sp. (in: high G+C Gram-positive bacteria)]
MINQTTLTLTFALIVVCVLGGWAVISLFLRARRQAAVEDLVLTGGNGGVNSEQAMIEQVQNLRATARERQILVGCLAVLALLTAVIGYLVAQVLMAFTGA